MTDTTGQRAQVVADLVALAKTARPDILVAISEFDSQSMPSDFPKHLEALKDLWTTYECRLNRQPDNSWYPLEPIELASYAVDGQSTVLSAYCNVILMIADLEDGRHDYMGYRWFQTPGSDWFIQLAPGFRDPLLAGFHILHSDLSEFEQDFWNGPTVMQCLSEEGKDNHG